MRRVRLTRDPTSSFGDGATLCNACMHSVVRRRFPPEGDATTPSARRGGDPVTRNRCDLR
ncbi:hypothetical protein SGL43_00492 [Streptomyces globisporus]|uniref:Uncharacterized protein n=1 Tax=Streptomyces globisporus TaxID=1908 RepID=A0ABN8UYC5_STRGL|nr:hypothetical protein SGL43_00492 [Streptomyces globisporus]